MAVLRYRRQLSAWPLQYQWQSKRGVIDPQLALLAQQSCVHCEVEGVWNRWLPRLDTFLQVRVFLKQLTSSANSCGNDSNVLT